VEIGTAQPFAKPGDVQRSDALVWAGVALAFSPALVELLAHWRAEAWACTSALALYLVVRSAAGLPRARPRPILGVAALALALGLEGFALAAGPAQLARVGLAVGLFGTALLLGRPSPRVAVLFLALVPVPFAVQDALDPLLRPILELPAAVLASTLGPPTQAGALGLHPGDAFLRVYASDLGLPLAVPLAAGAWAACARRRSSLAAALPLAAAAALLGLVLQTGVLAAGALALTRAGAPAARQVLDLAPLVLAILGTVALVEGMRPSERPR
jgi:hypothetical protein